MSGELVILGASGFLGRHVIDVVGDMGSRLRAVTRQPHASAPTSSVEWVQADLADQLSLERVLRCDDTVINLAFAPSAGTAENLKALDNLLNACVRQGVKRMVHCSTAMVVGSTSELMVDEATVCVPATPYEQCKFALEQRVLTAARSGLEVVILRPTAVLGVGGANLAALARCLMSKSSVLNYFRRSLFGNRQLHLVPVSTVVSAILHVADSPSSVDGETFFVSADDDADNRFLVVEEILRSSLGLPPFRIPPLQLPADLLSIALRLRGRSDIGRERNYSTDKLRLTGFSPTETVAHAVADFGIWFRNTQH